MWNDAGLDFDEVKIEFGNCFSQCVARACAVLLRLGGSDFCGGCDGGDAAGAEVLVLV